MTILRAIYKLSMYKPAYPDFFSKKINRLIFFGNFDRQRFLIFHSFTLIMCILSTMTANAGEPLSTKQLKFNVQSSFTLSPIVLPQDKDGKYYSLKTSSNQFRTSYFNDHNMLMHERIDIEERTDREPEDGMITIQIYEINDLKISTAGQIKVKARSGEFLSYGNVYKATQAACCDTSNRSIFFNLTTTHELFSTTTNYIGITYGSGAYRFIGYDDGEGSDMPKDMADDTHMLGILYFAGNGIKTKKLAVYYDKLDYRDSFRHQEIQVTVNKFTEQAASKWIIADKHDLQISDKILLDVKMFCRCDSDEKFSVAIKNDDFDLSEAQTSKAIKLFPIKD